MIRYADGAESLLPSPCDFYWRRDMSSGVQWPRRADEACEVRPWRGWSDAKGNTGALPAVPAPAPAAAAAAASTTSANAAAPDLAAAPARPPVAEVMATPERQLEESFLGRAHLQRLMRGRGAPVARVVLRARVLEAEGTALVPRTLWERRLDLGRQL